MIINFFLNSLSIHQAPLIRELSKKNDVNVFYDIGISEKRKSLGWEVPDFGSAKLLPLVDFDEVFIAGMTEKTVNVFSGLKAYKNIHRAFKKVIKNNKAKHIVQLEKLKLTGVKGLIKKVKYQSLARKYNGNIHCVISQGGKAQLDGLGFNNVYDFAYFLDKSLDPNDKENPEAKFVYLGALSKNKRTVELAACSAGCISLDIYGAELDVTVCDLESLTLNNALVNYKGTLPYSDVPSTLQQYDYLILPSKAEGWGAVVSEALLNGLSVVVTDVAGITHYLDGRVTEQVYIEDFSDMQTVVKKLQELKPLTIEQRRKIQKQAHCLSAEYGAELFKKVVS